MTATATYSDGTTGAISPTWSSINTGVATVSASGLVTAVAAGTATITGSSGSHSGTVMITVTNPTASLVTLDVRADDYTLKVGETTTVTAKAEYSDSSLDHMVTPTWTSSAPGVASVTADGVVTALAVGTTDIWGTYEGKRDEARIEVSSPPTMTSITTSVHSDYLLTETTLSLSRTLWGAVRSWANYSDGTSVPVEAVYSSDNENVVTVGHSYHPPGYYWNKVFPIGVGTATVTGTYQGHSATVTYTVTP